MRKLTSLILLAFISLLLSCASTESLRRASAGQIGCAPDDILVSDTSMGGGTGAWKAICHSKTYYCSSVGRNVSCKEEAK